MKEQNRLDSCKTCTAVDADVTCTCHLGDDDSTDAANSVGSFDTIEVSYVDDNINSQTCSDKSLFLRADSSVEIVNSDDEDFEEIYEVFQGTVNVQLNLCGQWILLLV